MLIRRSLVGEGIHGDEARRLLSDISLSLGVLKDAVGDVQEISAVWCGGRLQPSAKVKQAVQDMNELASAVTG
ncbi:hypothetical protein JOF53_006596 [Crossiella equi]|uniref:Uncharacterized protein n=1 Tax=Crossiella equi TaxID=130796 RepID=A0ABS5AMC0_9PSEU|nr:hypothetical protein [Crossiella equi]